MDDEVAPGAEWAVQAGAPLRVYEWLIPPVIPVGLAAIEICAATRANSHSLPLFSITGASLLAASALALWIFGYRAYRDLTPRAILRYTITGVISLFVTGALIEFGIDGIGLLPLAWAGRLAANVPLRPVRLARTLMPRRLWLHTAVIAAIIAVVSLLLLPLAIGLRLGPVIVLVMVARIIAPLFCGFAFGLRRASVIFTLGRRRP